MPSFTIRGLMAAMLARAGCAAQTEPSSSIYFVGDPPLSSQSYSVALGARRSRRSPNATAIKISAAYMLTSCVAAAVTHDIERCRRETIDQVAMGPDFIGLHDCMTFDCTACNIDQFDGRRINMS
jgi:hypothetical protein